MRGIICLVLLASLLITGEARPKDDGIQPVSHPVPAVSKTAATNGTAVKPQTPQRRFVAEGYGKRSIPDEGDPEEGSESGVIEGAHGKDTVVKEKGVEKCEENRGRKENEGKEEKGPVEESTGSAEETKPKISSPRDKRSPQRKDGTGEVHNDKSSEEDTSDDTAAATPIARPPRPGSHRTSEGDAAERERAPEKERKQPTEDVADAAEKPNAKPTSSRTKRSPHKKDRTGAVDDDKSSEEDTSDDTAAPTPIAGPPRPGSHRAAEGDATGKEKAPEKERKEEKEPTDETAASADESNTKTTSSRTKRNPDRKDGNGEVDNDKSSEEDASDGPSAATATSSVIRTSNPGPRRPTEGGAAQKGDTPADEADAKISSSRRKRSPPKEDAPGAVVNDKNSHTRDVTTRAPASTRTARPLPRRTTPSVAAEKGKAPERTTTVTPATKKPSQ